MFLSTEAIVFRVFPFRDSSYILKAFTEEYGLKSFIIRGSKKSKGNMRSKTQALNIVQVQWQERSQNELSYASSIDLKEPFKAISRDVERSSIVLFLSEILYKSIREEMQNRSLYHYIKNALLYLDVTEEYSNFHIAFLLKLTKYFGFIPLMDQKGKTDFFDMQEGSVFNERPDHEYYFSPENTELLNSFSGMNFADSESIKMTREKRNAFLDDIINYYRYHIDGMDEVKGHEVLQTVFS
ncbi:MAG: DNA repair protein RecO [Flavobacteriales bacterium]|nr:DNA repair protein RecO [Flavobacteriales bacterium]